MNPRSSGSAIASKDSPTATSAPSSVAAPGSQSLLPISIATLSASTVLAFDLYWQKGDRGKYILYRDRNFPLSQVDLDCLKDRGVETLYIVADDASQYRAYIEEHVLADETVPAVQRFLLLKEAARSVFLDSFRSKDATRCLEVAGAVGQQMVETLCRSRTALFDVFQVMTHDYGAFTHAVNAASNALLLAQGLGIHDFRVLFRIGQGALLHDFGKQFVPRAILEKNGPLNDQEQLALRKHPVDGFRELSTRDGLDWGQLMMVYQHHERCDGRGYPGAMTRREIHDHAQICSIADVTDALMRDRPYHNGYSLPRVVEYFQAQTGRALDKEMAQCWIAMLAQN